MSIFGTKEYIDAVLAEQRLAKNKGIYLTPQCSLCEQVLFIHENGIVEHGEFELCVNSGNKYRFDGKDKSEGEYDSSEILEQYRNIQLVLIEN